uniref:Uncharacterized protein n=1 Tax=candidate division CPR3 bacterium TaxID=2268181 RepID=A0A7C4R5X9_UNCC3
MKLLLDAEEPRIRFTLYEDDGQQLRVGFNIYDAKTSQHLRVHKVVKCLLGFVCREDELRVPSKRYGFSFSEEWEQGTPPDIRVNKWKIKIMDEFIQKFQEFVSDLIPGLMVDLEFHDMSQEENMYNYRAFRENSVKKSDEGDEENDGTH